jgi:hypothetical protein
MGAEIAKSSQGFCWHLNCRWTRPTKGVGHVGQNGETRAISEFYGFFLNQQNDSKIGSNSLMGPHLLRPLFFCFFHLRGLNTGVHFGDTKGHRKERAFRGEGNGGGQNLARVIRRSGNGKMPWAMGTLWGFQRA